MKNTSLFKERRTYFQNWDGNQFCVGDKTLCGSLLKAKRLAWQSTPAAGTRENIVYLRLRPTSAQAEGGEFPRYVAQLPGLRQLDVPVSLLEKIDARRDLPPQLQQDYQWLHSALTLVVQ